MKRLIDFVKTMRTWPDEVRGMLAFFSFAVSALLLFGVWNLNISSRLAAISTEEIPIETPQQTALAETETIATPAEGVAESLRSIGSLLPESPVRTKTMRDGTKRLLGSVVNGAGNTLYSIGEFFTRTIFD